MLDPMGKPGWSHCRGKAAMAAGIILEESRAGAQSLNRLPF